MQLTIPIVNHLGMWKGFHENDAPEVILGRTISQSCSRRPERSVEEILDIVEEVIKIIIVVVDVKPNPILVSAQREIAVGTE